MIIFIIRQITQKGQPLNNRYLSDKDLFVMLYKNLVKDALFLCLFLSLLLQTNLIQAPCPCPYVNSYCLPNQYCQCNSGFIMDCSIPALPFSGATSDASDVLIDYSYTFFSVTPLTIDSYIVFTFKICPILGMVVGNTTNVLIEVSMWGNSGRPIALDQNSAVDSKNYPISGECVTNKTSYFKFQLQPNRQFETLIIGIKLKEITSNPNNIQSLPINITIQQEEIFNSNLIFNLSFGILGVVGITCCIVVSCIAIRRLRNNAHHRQQIAQTYLKRKSPNIQHFNQMMPIKTARQLKVNLNSPCAVCLSQMVGSDSLRKTPCQHIFHSQCLDSWCLKNTICPFCRNGLLKKDIELYQKNRPKVDIEWQENPLSGREFDNQNNPMLQSRQNSNNIYQGGNIE